MADREKKTDEGMVTREKKADEKAPECNVSGCYLPPVTRGLCDAHWSTHRGLADPAEEVAPEETEAKP